MDKQSKTFLRANHASYKCTIINFSVLLLLVLGWVGGRLVSEDVLHVVLVLAWVLGGRLEDDGWCMDLDYTIDVHCKNCGVKVYTIGVKFIPFLSFILGKNFGVKQLPFWN